MLGNTLHPPYVQLLQQVKISNLMRVLGEEATMDPTAIEQQVRQQMEERSQVRGPLSCASSCPMLVQDCGKMSSSTAMCSGRLAWYPCVPILCVLDCKLLPCKCDKARPAVMAGARGQERGAEADALGAAGEEARQAHRRGGARHPGRSIQGGTLAPPVPLCSTCTRRRGCRSCGCPVHGLPATIRSAHCSGQC